LKKLSFNDLMSTVGITFSNKKFSTLYKLFYINFDFMFI